MVVLEYEGTDTIVNIFAVVVDILLVVLFFVFYSGLLRATRKATETTQRSFEITHASIVRLEYVNGTAHELDDDSNLISAYIDFDIGANVPTKILSIEAQKNFQGDSRRYHINPPIFPMTVTSSTNEKARIHNQLDIEKKRYSTDHMENVFVASDYIYTIIKYRDTASQEIRSVRFQHLCSVSNIHNPSKWEVEVVEFPTLQNKPDDVKRNSI